MGFVSLAPGSVVIGVTIAEPARMGVIGRDFVSLKLTTSDGVTGLGVAPRRARIQIRRARGRHDGLLETLRNPDTKPLDLGPWQVLR